MLSNIHKDVKSQKQDRRDFIVKALGSAVSAQFWLPCLWMVDGNAAAIINYILVVLSIPKYFCSAQTETILYVLNKIKFREMRQPEMESVYHLNKILSSYCSAVD